MDQSKVLCIEKNIFLNVFLSFIFARLNDWTTVHRNLPKTREPKIFKKKNSVWVILNFLLYSKIGTLLILQNFQERNSVWVILNYLLFSKIGILLILQQLKVRILVPWECVGWIFMRHTSVNIFGKYLFKFRQIYCSNCTNTFCNFNKYILQSKVHIFWTNLTAWKTH